MNDQERQINEAAKFVPMKWEGPDGSYDTPYTKPHMEVGGVQIYGYREDGVLHVSLDYDGAQKEVTTGDDARVLTKVSASGDLVWDSEAHVQARDTAVVAVFDRPQTASVILGVFENDEKAQAACQEYHNDEIADEPTALVWNEDSATIVNDRRMITGIYWVRMAEMNNLAVM